MESLEDRVTPVVSATQNAGGVLTVTLSDQDDTVTLTGTAASGDAIDVTGTGLATESFTKVTAINVVDSGSHAGLAATFNDAGAGTAIDITGAIVVSGVESVTLATANGPIHAESLVIAGATAEIDLNTDIETTGANGQSYGGPVKLGAATVTLDAADGDVTFTSAVDGATAGANALVVNAGGATSFGGTVGSTTALDSLTTDAAGTTSLGSNVTTVAGQTYNDPVVIVGTTVVVSSTLTGAIAFADTVNGQTAGKSALTVNTTGATSFGGAIGDTATLASVVTDGAGTTSLAGNVTTSGAQSFGDPLTLIGTAITLTSTGNGNVFLASTLDGQTAGTTALTVNTSGTLTFGGNVGATTSLLSLTTDAGGSVVFGSAVGTLSVRTDGAQTFNDAARLNAASTIFASLNNGDITFGGTLNGTTAGSNNAQFNTGGKTTLTGAVGGTVALGTLGTDNAGQSGEQTIIRAGVATTGDQGYDDAVTITPNSGITSVLISSTSGGVTFESTLGGDSPVPVTVRANLNLGFNGDVSFTAPGSQFTAHAGNGGVGQVLNAPGLTFRADNQIWRSGNGPGGMTGSAADLITNTPAFRDAAGTAAPRIFVLRQDAAVNDASVPTPAQFGGTTPATYTILSDDGSLTLTSATIAGPGTQNLTLAAAQALSLGIAINSPLSNVRLRSSGGEVTQTAGGITSAALGILAGAGIDLSAADNSFTTFAAKTTSGNFALQTTAPYTVGTVGPDPLAIAFQSVTGITAAGTLDLTAAAGSALDVTIAAPVSGTSVTATGNTANDRVTVNYSLGATLANGLTFNGGDGSDSFILLDTGGDKAHTYVVDGSITRDGGSKLAYSAVESISATGGNLGDSFTITPDGAATISVTGGLPDSGATTGDKLTVNLAGATNPVLTTSQAADGLQGSASFDNRQPVTFNQIESLSPQADIRVTQTAPATIGAGEAITITITVTNLGTDAATGVSVTDLFPSVLSATWTASATSGSSVAASSGTGDINTTVDLAANGSVTFTVTATASQSALGVVTNTVSAGNSDSAFDPSPANNQASSSITVGTVGLTATGAGAGGGPQIRVFNADGSERFSFFAFDPSFLGGVTVATGDVTGDGFEDIVVGSASGAAHVKVYDGRSGSEVASFFAFPGFGGGVNVAVAGGQVIAGAGIGGGPIVKGFRLAGGVTESFSILAYDAGFRGGVQVAGSSDYLAVGAGPGGGPHVKVFDINGLTQISSFFAFPAGTADGVSVALGTLNGRATVIAGAGVDSPPTVATLDALTGSFLGSFTAFDSRFQGGVRVATGVAADGRETIVVGAGPGGAPRVRFLAPDRTQISDFFAFDSSFRGGVFVG